MLPAAALALLMVGFAMSGMATHAEEETVLSILSIDPVSGGPGTYVWVEGTGFSENDTVTFGGYAIEHDVESDELFGFYAPSAAMGEYEIGIMNDNSSDAYCCFELTDEEPEEDPANDTEPEDEDDPRRGDVNDPSCRQSGMNVQCSDFGTIRMKAQENILGEPVTIDIEVLLDTNYEDADARAVMFSVRNVTANGDSPVEVLLKSIGTAEGELVTDRVEQVNPNEINIWVDVLDTPVGSPINLTVEVGSTERGAYQLEALVMPFDRGYEPIKDRFGRDISLYSYTLLGVNDATDGVVQDGGLSFRGVPGPGPALLLATVGLLGLLLPRRNGR